MFYYGMRKKECLSKTGFDASPGVANTGTAGGRCDNVMCETVSVLVDKHKTVIKVGLVALFEDIVVEKIIIAF